MNIDYTIDLDGFGFIKSVSNYTSLRDHRLTHRDKLSLKVRFTRSGVAQDIGTLNNSDTHFTLKKLNEENEVLSDDSTVTTWTQGGTSPDVYYTHDGYIDLGTNELSDLIGQSASVQVDAQFTWKVGSTVYRSRLLKTTIDRALYPSTLPATLATDPSRSYVTMLQSVNQLDGDSLPATGRVTLESVSTVGLQVPRWFSFVRADDGILYYYQLRAGTDADASPLTTIRRPDDYHATTNAKVFDFQVIAYSGGTNLTDSATDTTVTVISDVGTDAVLVAPTPQAAGILVASERSVVTLAQSALSGSVSFSAAFDSAPQNIFLTVKMSSAINGSPVSTSSVIFAVSYAVTASGFKYWLSGPPDDGDHELHWWAIL